MKFYLGTDRANWLWNGQLNNVPLFVSHRTLRRYKNFQPATTNWSLDSGGFTELSLHGEWTIRPSEYIAAIRRYQNEIGMLDWASPQDWMCEPVMLKRTGKNIDMHQWLTINNFLELRWQAPDLPIIPALQGWERDDYLRHVDYYMKAGIDLTTEPLVGLGSVCRRQATWEAAEITQALQPLRLHAYGAKRDAIGLYGELLTSCDSMAWSYTGRYSPDPNCPKRACAHCLHFALDWREKALNPERPTLWGTSNAH